MSDGYFSDHYLIHHHQIKNGTTLDELMGVYLITIWKEWR
jgi:hypothetical protein